MSTEYIEHKCDKSPYTFLPSIYQSHIIKEEWILDIFDAMIEIKYCPWCGYELPTVLDW